MHDTHKQTHGMLRAIMAATSADKVAAGQDERNDFDMPILRGGSLRVSPKFNGLVRNSTIEFVKDEHVIISPALILNPRETSFNSMITIVIVI